MSATKERRMQTLPPARKGGVPMGLYVMQLTDIFDAGQSQFADNNGVFNQQAKWVCTIVEVIDTEADDPDELIGTTYTKYTNQNMAKKANMRKFTEAFLGRDLDENEQADIDEIIGSYAKVHLAEKQGDKGIEVHVTMTPSKGPKRAAKKPKAAPVVDEEDIEDDDAPDF